MIRMTTIQLNVPDELAVQLTESAVDQGQFDLFLTSAIEAWLKYQQQMEDDKLALAIREGRQNDLVEQSEIDAIFAEAGV